MPRPNSSVAKAPMFGVPSLEVAGRIDNQDAVCRLRAAHYRLAARLHELEARFEEKASELRRAFLDETSEILSGSEEE
jgi:hypothetical protein